MPDLLGDEPNLPPHQPSSPSPRTERQDTWETERACDGLLPPRPIYVASYEQESNPILVNHLIPRPTTEGGRDTNKMGKYKTAVDRENLIEIRDEDESDWVLDYSCSY